ncbi:MAG: hypothetical protein WC655_26830 [Candidatus Hydrogenedentales bacterium]
MLKRSGFGGRIFQSAAFGITDDAHRSQTQQERARRKAFEGVEVGGLGNPPSAENEGE